MLMAFPTSEHPFPIPHPAGLSPQHQPAGNPPSASIIIIISGNRTRVYRDTAPVLTLSAQGLASMGRRQMEHTLLPRSQRLMQAV
jgi:hypothetical protein